MAELEFEKESTQEEVVIKQTVPEDDSKEEPVQTDLFGNPIEPEEVAGTPAKKAEKKEEKKEKKMGSSKKVEKVNREFTVYYAGNQLEVPEDDMTLEDLRRHLELEFPELSKERTEMTVDVEKKHVVPVVKGAKKG